MQRQTFNLKHFTTPPPELVLLYSLREETFFHPEAAQLLHLLKHPAPTRAPPWLPPTHSTPTGHTQQLRRLTPCPGLLSAAGVGPKTPTALLLRRN